MLNFYGKNKDPFRTTADVSIPLIEGRVKSVRAELGGKLLQQTVEGELHKHFVLSNLTDKWYLDEDGDLVILDDLDSFQVAYDFARRTGKGLKVVVDAAKKEVNTAAEHGIPEMSRPHSTRSRPLSESSITVSDFSAMDEPPAWLEAMMDKMRGELKAELMESLHVSGRSSGSTGRLGSAMRERRDSATLPHDCDLCCQPIADVRYFCLNKCGSVLCPTCVQNVGHDEEHVLLRLAPNYRGKPKRLVSQAELVLRGMRVVPSPPRYSRGSIASEVVRDLEAKACSAAVIADVIDQVEHTATAATVAHADASGESKLADFDAFIERESKTGLMNDLGGGVGAYWKQWTIRNIGSSNWRDVKLYSIDVCCDKLQPFAPAAAIPALEPGQCADLMVWMYGPVSEAGVYDAHWRLRTTQGVEFGPQLLFDFTVGDQNTNERATASPDDDGFSIVGTVDDPDFELVSDVASTLSFSPSIAPSGRSTPAEHEDFSDAHSEQVDDDEKELSTAAASLINSLEFAQCAETENAGDVASVETATACSFDSPLLDQSLIVDSALPAASDSSGVETAPSSATDEHSALDHESVPAVEPTVHLDSSPYRIPERPDVSVNRVLVGAVKAASKAVDRARDVAEKAVGKAQQWRPSAAAWTPRATQTDWSAPDDWTAPQPWRPSTPVERETLAYDPHKMESLVEMGFTDIDHNAQVLRQLNGDMGAVVDFLLQNMQSNP